MRTNEVASSSRFQLVDDFRRSKEEFVQASAKKERKVTTGMQKNVLYYAIFSEWLVVNVGRSWSMYSNCTQTSPPEKTRTHQISRTSTSKIKTRRRKPPPTVVLSLSS